MEFNPKCCGCVCAVLGLLVLRALAPHMHMRMHISTVCVMIAGWNPVCSMGIYYLYVHLIWRDLIDHI